MEAKYDFRRIEPKWRKFWDKHRFFNVEADPSRQKYYLLEMFPYPSGRIHMGHVRNYSIADVVSRFLFMKGYNVLHPIGWDAFGMPAENAAIENKSHPAKWTQTCIENMRNQLKTLGLSYDWERELATCDPEYYRWEQWLFTRMLERGLAYKRKSYVNWCDSCRTVLANEQVEAGTCWRCHGEVVQKELDQWFLRITEYADELLDWIEQLPGWPERVLAMQRNWIGKSHGAEIHFAIDGTDEVIKVFTTRPDTLYGATFMSMAPENPLIERLISGRPEAAEVREKVGRMLREDKTRRAAEDYEKEGVFTGAYCINPMTGKKMPIFVANFVLMEYGTGSVMAVPTHDQRDFEFAKKYGLDLIVVIGPPGQDLDPAAMECAYVDDGVMVNSGEFNGLGNREAMDAIVTKLERIGMGRKTTSYRLRDWGVSRQRYWGAPIPVIYCDKCGVVGVPDEDLPVVLPTDVKITGEGGSPLSQIESFVRTACPKCGGEARRETDTFDTFMESSWYFVRYCSPNCSEAMVDAEAVDYWMPVDQYIGGIEHAIMHLLYARFFTKVLRDLEILSVDEPFKNLLTQGMVIKDGAKMSKSRGNVVDPDEIIAKYGADTARLFILFSSPPEKELEWSDRGVEGSFRFLNRVWRMVYDWKEIVDEVPEQFQPPPGPMDNLHRKAHYTIMKVETDIRERFHFNTAISAVMELVNLVYQVDRDKCTDPDSCAVMAHAVRTVVIALYPFVPHICEEMWSAIGDGRSLAQTPWPSYDPALIKQEEIEMVIQVNGKVRSRITVSADADEDEVKQLALENERIRKFIEGKQIRRVIHVPRKLVNIVVS